MRLVRFFVASLALAFAASDCASGEEAPGPAVNVPGSLVILSPARAAFIAEGDPVHVRGAGASRALTINGNPVPVSADGLFETDLTPQIGLNLIEAVDGHSRLESPFMYGHFVMNEPVAQGITIDLGPGGIGAADPSASIASVANGAFGNYNAVGMLDGKQFTGTNTVDWTFTFIKGQNGPIHIDVGPADGALAVNAQVSTIHIDGHLQITKFGVHYDHDVTITVDRARAAGNLVLSIDKREGALGAAMPDAEAALDGFKFDTDNAGFPCCVDSILTGVIKPKIQDTIRDQIREQLPKVVSVTLEGVGVPKQIDLSFAKIPATVPITTKFDDVATDLKGGFLSASTLFGGAFESGTPGAKGPGSLFFGGVWDSSTRPRPESAGVTISLDALNQLLYAAWGSGKAAFTLPPPFAFSLTPALPPLISITDKGGLRLSVGELVATRVSETTPVAGATVLQDVKLDSDGNALVLTPVGAPTVSVTWLAQDADTREAKLVMNAAKEGLMTFLKPFKLPIPKIALDKLGSSFAGRALVIEKPVFAVDATSARANLTGELKLSP